MIAIELLLCLLALATLVPVTVLFVQVVMALPAYQAKGRPSGRRPAIAILMPACNESLVIADTLRSIVPQLVPGDRLLVVADNCSDDTATIAAMGGAEVIQRNDEKHRGKGFALDFGVRHIEQAAPEVVLIIDADCNVERNAIDRLASACLESGRPVQSLFLMQAPENSGLRARTGEFAWLVRNQVRPLGYHRLGLPCQLMGSGMAFPWPILSTASLANGHLVEDLMLAINLARSGTAPLFCPEARLTSWFPSSADGLIRQRTRWEHGHLSVILHEAPRLFAEAIVRRDPMRLALAFDLCVPPLALLTLLVLSVFAVSAVLMATAGIMLPFGLAASSLLLLGSGVLMSWGHYGRHVISLGDLAFAPFYALWKLPLYFKFLVKRQTDWVRSRRDAR